MIYIWIAIILLRVDIGILISNDASIKKLNNIYITKNGYALNGAMIGFDILDNPLNDIDLVYQAHGKIYCKSVNHWNDGSVTAGYNEFHVNIVYI